MINPALLSLNYENWLKNLFMTSRVENGFTQPPRYSRPIMPPPTTTKTTYMVIQEGLFDVPLPTCQNLVKTKDHPACNFDL